MSAATRDYASVGRYRVSVAAGAAANLGAGRSGLRLGDPRPGPAHGDLLEQWFERHRRSVVAYHWDFGDGHHLRAGPDPHLLVPPAADLSGDPDGHRRSRRRGSLEPLTVVVTHGGNRVASLELSLHARSAYQELRQAAVGRPPSPTAHRWAGRWCSGRGRGADKRWVLGITDEQGNVRFDSLSVRNARADYGFTVLWVGYLESPYDWSGRRHDERLRVERRPELLGILLARLIGSGLAHRVP